MPTLPPTNDDVRIQLLERAALVLGAVGTDNGRLRLTDLGERLHLPKTTIHRIVNGLAHEGLLRIDPAGRLWLGAALVALAQVASSGLAAQLRPVLDHLHSVTDETVDLSVPDGASMHFVDQIRSSHRLQAMSAVGERFPLHCTANGKALLAALGTDRALELTRDRLVAFTPDTITDVDHLVAELDAVRATGVAYDHEEHTVGISAAAVLIVDPNGPVAAISIPAPTSRFTTIEPELRTALIEARSRAEALLRA